MEKIKKLNIITGIVLAGFIIAIIYHFILGTVFHLGYPYNTFLFNPAARFGDFIYNYNIFETFEFNPYVQTFLHVNYFPFGMLTLYFFRFFPILPSLIIYYFVVFGFFAFYNYKNIKQNLSSDYKFNILISFFVITFMSYPALLMMDRGHNDSFIFIFTALFIYFFMKEKYLNAVLICAIPIAIKGYAITYLALFLAKKKFKEVFYCLLLAFLLTIFSLSIAKGGIINNISFMLGYHMPYFKDIYVIHDGSMWNSSLFGFIKLIIYYQNNCFSFITHKATDLSLQFNSIGLYCTEDVYTNLVEKVLSIYTPLAFIATLFVIFYIIFIEKEFWKKVTLLFISSIIFPPMASDLKLFSLYIPLWLFINANNKNKMDWLYSILFALILIPQNYLQFITARYYGDSFNISAALHPIILLVLLIVIISEGFYTKFRNSYTS